MMRVKGIVISQIALNFFRPAHNQVEAKITSPEQQINPAAN